MKKSIKIILVVSLIIICLITTSYGFGVDDLPGNPNGTGEIENIGNSIITILTSIGIVVSVITAIAGTHGIYLAILKKINPNKKSFWFGIKG